MSMEQHNARLMKPLNSPEKINLLSVIVPLYNEADNIILLYEKMARIAPLLKCDLEMVLVNDGSTDGSRSILDDLADRDRRVKVIHFRRNFGQTTAIMAGIDYSSGEVLIPMDGDLQNDPEDIPKLLAKLQEGYQVCSGWRKERKDNPLKRNLPSHIANWLISAISGVHLHDYGCTLKAYRSEVIKGVKLYGEMHRFIPIYATWQGARVAEIPVTHHPRMHGKSKYGLERTFKVIMDLIVVKFLAQYAQKPIYFFGAFGLFSLFIAFIAVLAALYYKIFEGKPFIETPLPDIVIMASITGVMCILMGLLAEIIMRTYYESQDKPVYLIDACRNLERK